MCEMCPQGLAAAPDRSECLPCPDTHVSLLGVCERCPDGSEPNSNSSGCVLCLAGRAGVGGACEFCGDGTQQNNFGTECEACPIGRAGVEGMCAFCQHPLMQSHNLTTCTLQVYPPYYSFRQERCSVHPSCVENFAHAHNLDALTCCPTHSGDLLSCCQFEDAAEERFWKSVADGLDLLITACTDAFVTPALAGVGFFALSGFVFRARFAKSYTEFREGVLISWACIPALLLGGLAISLATPWLVLSLLATLWLPYATIRIFARFYSFVWVQSDCRHEHRPHAMRKLTKWLWVNFVVEYCLTHIFWISDWITLRLLMGDMLRIANVDFLKPLPFEYTISKVRAPVGLKTFLQHTARLLWELHSILANVPLHVDVHADRLAPSVLLIGCTTLGVALSSYVLLICNVYGRLAAGRHGFLQAKRANMWRMKQTLKTNLWDAGFTSWMYCTGLCIARGQLSLLEFVLARQVPSSLFDQVTLGSLFVFVLVVYAALLYMWVGVANGKHVDDPPVPIAWAVSRYTGIEFDTAKRQHYLIKVILETFDVFEEEEAASVASPHGSSPHSKGMSPRGRGMSPRGRGMSPRGRGMSPRGRGMSPRGRMSPHGRGISPRGMSPRGMSPRGLSPRSPKSASPSGSSRSPRGRQAKIAKNLGSAKRLLQRTFGNVATIAAPASPSSPASRPGRHNGAGSPVDDLYRLGDVPPPSALPMAPQTFIRLPDLTKASFGRVALAAARAAASAQKAVPVTEHLTYRDSETFRDQTTEFPMTARLSGNSSGRNAEAPMTGQASGNSSARKSDGPLTDCGEALVTGTHGKRTRCTTCWPRVGRKAQSAIAKQLSRRRNIAAKLKSRLQPMEVRPKGSLLSPAHLREYDTGGELADRIDKTMYTETPMELFNRIPKPKNDISWRACARRSTHAAGVSLWTSIGHWKETRNVGNHKVCARARDLAEETCRYKYDQLDYYATARSVARTVSMSLRWLPGGIIFSVFALYLNWPLLRQCDKSMDIMWHKIQEIMEKGASYKEAEVSLWRSILSTPAHKTKLQLTRRCLIIQKILSAATLAMMIVASLLLTGDNADWLGPPVFFVAFFSLFLHVLIGQVILPILMLPNAIYLSVARESTEEKEIAELIKAQQDSSDSSATQDSSSEYSSSNESFLDEDRRSAGRASVIGVKRNRIVIRPQSARLRLRFQLMQRLGDCQEYIRKWRRVGPEKHGRLFTVEGKFGVARRPWETVSFVYSEDSDMSLKVQQFFLRRSNSIGTSTGEELCERRDVQEHWAGYVDVFEEGYRPGIPAMPNVVNAMPNRGVVDMLEKQLVFKAHPNVVTNQQIILVNPLQGTAVHRHLTGVKEVPWEHTYDEMLASFKASAASAASATEAEMEDEPAE